MLALTGRFEADLPVAEVDVTSTADLARLLDRSDVVLSTVGPFMQLGIATVTAAAQAGAHYLDSSGEGSFVRRVFELDPVADRPSCRPSATTTYRATSPARSP
jgi:short subunit dehydrogenase-like uncharacterized protein